MSGTKSIWRLVLCLGVIAFLSSCNLSLISNNSSELQPPQLPLSGSLEEPVEPEGLAVPLEVDMCSDLPDYRVQLKITTSTENGAIRLLSGASWDEIALISTSQEIADFRFGGNQIEVEQLLTTAKMGDPTEIVAEGLISCLQAEETLVFELERNKRGFIQVEILVLEQTGFSPVTTLRWAGRRSSDLTTEVFEVSPQPFLGAEPNEYIVISQLNFWYFGDGPYGGFENSDGSRSTPFIPLYGDTYWSDDPDWVFQQIEWAVEYGVDAFSIEWDGPEEESLGVPMEEAIDEVFLVSPNIHKVRWAIFYDFNLRIHYLEDRGVDPSQPPNLNQQVVYETFVSDFVHFATKYFHHPQYLTIDDRPVVYIWATQSFSGNVAGAVEEARQQVTELGYDVYIVGDEVCYGCFNGAKASLFDANTSFTFLIPGVDQPQLRNVGQAAETTDTAYTWWRGKIASLNVVGREEKVNFQPGWAPQYDESWISEFTYPTVVLAESREQVVQMADVARKHAEPVGEEGMKLVWVNTWNCWGEGTTIEPTIDDQNKYPGGNYGFDFLEIIREVYGVETYYTSP